MVTPGKAKDLQTLRSILFDYGNAYTIFIEMALQYFFAHLWVRLFLITKRGYLGNYRNR